MTRNGVSSDLTHRDISVKVRDLILIRLLQINVHEQNKNLLTKVK